MRSRTLRGERENGVKPVRIKQYQKRMRESGKRPQRKEEVKADAEDIAQAGNTTKDEVEGAEKTFGGPGPYFAEREGGLPWQRKG